MEASGDDLIAASEERGHEAEALERATNTTQNAGGPARTHGDEVRRSQRSKSRSLTRATSSVAMVSLNRCAAAAQKLGVCGSLKA